jgi:alpha-L-fucosidase
MKTIVLSGIMAMLVICMAEGQASRQLATPSAKQYLWQDMELSMFVHFAPETWQGTESDNHTTELNRINPGKLDVNQWIDAAESFGAKMIIFVAKHVGGFCMWQTETTDYSIKNTTYKNGKGDVLDELALACSKRGMKLGIYIYPGDDTWGAYQGGGGRTEDPAKQEGYSRVLRKQWEEVLSRYGHQIEEIWFDGGLVIPLEDIINKYSPHAIVFQGPFADIRWVGNERGFAPYPAWNTVKREDLLAGHATAADGDPDGDKWIPLEVDTPLKDHYWMWSIDNEKNLKSLDELIEIYYKSVGRGAVLLLNSAPDTTGLIPEADMKLYRQFGDEIIRRFGKSIANTEGKGDIVELELGSIQEIDHVITMEDIAFGERVREYVIEGNSGEQWFAIARGISIGHKKIDRFEPVRVSKIRFRCLNSAATPVIRKLSAYSVKDTNVYNKLRSTTDDHGVPWTRGETRKYESPVFLGKLMKFHRKDEERYLADLSKYIDEPGQYELYIARPADGRLKLPDKADIFLDGNKTPGIGRINENYYTIGINIASVPSMKEGSIVVGFTITGVEQEADVYLRKVVYE